MTKKMTKAELEEHNAYMQRATDRTRELATQMNFGGKSASAGSRRPKQSPGPVLSNVP